ncbi:hypothetical protein [Bifidobacterium sp. SO4]|uniref:hypothetical protein n=1 Tax=Bifidobacterium sp. SO4 TaxID=2809030 RepID=UPI001BDCDBFC|nr:hypothetical protein [Bifidobacterium sp. SO4]MBT1169955.1 hypothetical protein [Bifidobacterium sp. SO4]
MAVKTTTRSRIAFETGRLKELFRPSSHQAVWVLCAQAYFFFSYTFVYTFGLPRALLYINDALNVLIFVFALYERKSTARYTSLIIGLMALYCAFGVVGGILNAEKLLALIWGYRNIVRYFMYFYTCVVFLKKTDIDIVLRVVSAVFWISVPLCAVERFLVQYPAGTIVGDMVGGIFWNFSGSNLPLNVIICLYLILIASRYFDREIKTPLFLAVLVAATFMAAAAELKVYFAELVIILLAAMIGKKISWRTIGVVLLGVATLAAASSYFVILNAGKSSTYASNYSLQGYLDYATSDAGYDGVGDLNRFSGIETVSDAFFHHDPLSLLFGIGLGNADYTNFFSTDFYNQHYSTHYQWFHAIWMFIENGYVGVILYLSIIAVAWLACRRYIPSGQTRTMAQVTCILMVVLFFYNITLRMEPTGYLLMLIMSVPYIYAMNGSGNQRNTNTRKAIR